MFRSSSPAGVIPAVAGVGAKSPRPRRPGGGRQIPGPQTVTERDPARPRGTNPNSRQSRCPRPPRGVSSHTQGRDAPMAEPDVTPSAVAAPPPVFVGIDVSKDALDVFIAAAAAAGDGTPAAAGDGTPAARALRVDRTDAG